VITAKE